MIKTLPGVTGSLSVSKKISTWEKSCKVEYKIKPGDIEIELRIYQNDEIVIHNPTAEDILPIMDKIIHLDKLIQQSEGRS